jgi:hypothetical protein
MSLMAGSQRAPVEGPTALSVIVRIVVQTGSDLSDAVGWTGGAGAFSSVVEVVSSTLVIFGALLALYRFVPPVTMPLAQLWPSALAAAVVFHVAVYGYAVYATVRASTRSMDRSAPSSCSCSSCTCWRRSCPGRRVSGRAFRPRRQQAAAPDQ